MMKQLDDWLEGYERAMWSSPARYYELRHFTNMSRLEPLPRRKNKSVIINTLPTVGNKEESNEQE